MKTARRDNSRRRAGGGIGKGSGVSCRGEGVMKEGRREGEKKEDGECEGERDGESVSLISHEF